MLQAIWARREDGQPRFLTKPSQLKLHTAALTAVMTMPDVPPQLAPAVHNLLPAAMHLLLALKQKEVGCSLTTATGMLHVQTCSLMRHSQQNPPPGTANMQQRGTQRACAGCA